MEKVRKGQESGVRDQKSGGRLVPGAAPGLGTPRDVEHLLIWAYRDQKARDWMRAEANAAIGRAVRHRSHSVDGVYALGRIGALGCRVDDSGGGWDWDLHPDAEAAADQVAMLYPGVQELVVRHARSGTRPDWMEGARHRLEPVGWTGRKRALTQHVGSDKTPRYCPIVERDPPELVAAARDAYVLWWRALTVIASNLALKRLKRYVVTGPKAPMRPWEAGVGDQRSGIRDRGLDGDRRS